MKYKLELITSVVVIDKMISEMEDQLLILTTDRNEETIKVKNQSKAEQRKANAIAETSTKLTETTNSIATMPEGKAKEKKIGLQKTLEARLFNLNLEDDTTPGEEIAYGEYEKEQLEGKIEKAEDFLLHLRQRKTQLESGTGS
jgi:hypothetical protein